MGLSILQKVTPVIMKVLFIAATLALASAGFAPSCEECNAAAAGLLARLTSADSIAEQTGILISQVCPQAADACEQLGLCKKSSGLLGDWTCDDCTAIMTRVAEFMKEPSTIEQGVGVLTGECFCGAEGHTDECPGL